MYIVHVIPIAKGVTKETLAYFSSEHFIVGSIVEVPLRQKSVTGIVLDCQSAEDQKAEIKSADFEMRKISSAKATRFFLPEFIEAAKVSAEYFATSSGAIINTLTSKIVLTSVEKIIGTHTDNRQVKIHEKYILQSDEEERFAHYKSLIRETFAKKGSVFFCLPSLQDIQTSIDRLEKGIEEYTFVLHGSLSKKEITERCQKILSTTHPVLIIATGPFLSLPRSDIGTIIVERESSRSYKTQTRPFIDLRTFSETLAKHLQAKIVFGDIFLQTETIFRYQQGEFQELYAPKFRSLTTCEPVIEDLRAYKTEGLAGTFAKKYTIIGHHLTHLIQHNQENNEHLFVFVARKGLSPTTICGDCGTIVTCNTCQSPMVLHGLRAGNYFLCHKCGERRTAQETCKSCTSWKLVTLGSGTEKVADEIQKMFPKLTLFSLDKDRAKTHSQAGKIAKKFYETPGSVLVGTEMALLYLNAPIENSAIATVDSLFSIPDFRISERVFSLLLQIRSLTQRKFILQTRNPDQPLFQHALKGNIIDFYREEIHLRQMFNYPPQCVLIKISLEGKKDEIATLMASAREQFADYEVDIFPSFIKGRAGSSIINALLRVPRKEWPEKTIIQKLAQLGPQFTIKVDPDSLL